MKIDERALDELLRAAARSQPPLGEMPGDLAGQVRRLRTRRRRNRRLAGSLAVMAILFGGILWTTHSANEPEVAIENPVSGQSASSDPSSEQPTVDVEQLRREIAALSAEADARQQIIDELLARQRYREETARLEEQLAQPDPMEVARMEIEKAAFLLVDCAQQQSSRSATNNVADQYRRVIEHFPSTMAARTAETRLRELINNEGAL